MAVGTTWGVTRWFLAVYNSRKPTYPSSGMSHVLHREVVCHSVALGLRSQHFGAIRTQMARGLLELANDLDQCAETLRTAAAQSVFSEWLRVEAIAQEIANTLRSKTDDGDRVLQCYSWFLTDSDWWWLSSQINTVRLEQGLSPKPYSSCSNRLGIRLCIHPLHLHLSAFRMMPPS
jgi:hypothetical protein